MWNDLYLHVLLRSAASADQIGAPGSINFAGSNDSSSSNSSSGVPGRSLLQFNPRNVPTIAPSNPVQGWGQFTSSVDPKMAKGTRIPNSFLGTSHEWTRLTDWGDNLPAFTEIFRHLGPNPILRLGGASQDKMTVPPKREVYEVLKKLHQSANVR